MTRRILVVGLPDTLRSRIARALDDVFDADVDEHAQALVAMRLLPNHAIDLVIALADGGDAPGEDLVDFVRGHAIHGAAPVLLVGGSESARRAAEAAGATLMGPEPSEDAIRLAVREALGLG